MERILLGLMAALLLLLLVSQSRNDEPMTREVALQPSEPVKELGEPGSDSIRSNTPMIPMDPRVPASNAMTRTTAQGTLDVALKQFSSNEFKEAIVSLRSLPELGLTPEQEALVSRLTREAEASLVRQRKGQNVPPLDAQLKQVR